MHINIQRYSILTLFILLVLNNAMPQSIGYIEALEKERTNKDAEFMSSEDSPLTAESKKTFQGLNYFPPDTSFVITASIDRFPNPDTIKMKTTTERLPLYLRYGTVSFTLEGQQHRVTIFQNVALMSTPGFEDYLFLPFTDITSGEESYGGGRYIEASLLPDGSVTIDFNRAFNPYCVYNKRYSCPIPPSENFINARINAGEKNFH